MKKFVILFADCHDRHVLESPTFRFADTIARQMSSNLGKSFIVAELVYVVKKAYLPNQK